MKKKQGQSKVIIVNDFHYVLHHAYNTKSEKKTWIELVGGNGKQFLHKIDNWDLETAATYVHNMGKHRFTRKKEQGQSETIFFNGFHYHFEHVNALSEGMKTAIKLVEPSGKQFLCYSDGWDFEAAANCVRRMHEK